MVNLTLSIVNTIYFFQATVILFILQIWRNTISIDCPRIFQSFTRLSHRVLDIFSCKMALYDEDVLPISWLLVVR